MDIPKNSLNVAVIGSGIAGLAASWLLSKNHNVTLYEKDGRLGGHSNTVEVSFGMKKINVDTGFIVFNNQNYPNLVALFTHLDVDTKSSDMSFSASLRDGTFEYSGTNLRGLFGQPSNALRLSFWQMLFDLNRFYKSAPAALKSGELKELALGDYLRKKSFSAAFTENHILPMGAAIWSTTSREMKNYPAEAFVRFFKSHGLLQITDRPEWRTVTSGSAQYVNKLIDDFSGTIRMIGVNAIERGDNCVMVRENGGDIKNFDQVVVATHADQALALLTDPSKDESAILGAWRYTKNRAFLHSDPKFMPRRKHVWASWNFIQNTRNQAETPLCVTYWMNSLQSIPDKYPLFVTLNPPQTQNPVDTHSIIDYEHPFYDRKALASQNKLWSLQGKRRTWFCGSYFGYGFHEDGLQSGLLVAEKLGGVKRPWHVPEESSRIIMS
ncbi:MAG: FAD-dependent oxidoreductase [Pseudomonadota bacterium]|nr:FAD-dependent oxidoreductase [Pseudomonadota bacterium]